MERESGSDAEALHRPPIEPPRRALDTRRGAHLRGDLVAVPRNRPLSPISHGSGSGRAEASHHLNVIAFTADLIFCTITSANSVPCFPLRSCTLGARPGCCPRTYSSTVVRSEPRLSARVAASAALGQVFLQPRRHLVLAPPPDAIASIARSASSTLGREFHAQRLIPTKRRSATHAARLLPSGSGWLRASRTASTAALSTKSG
jgi:hypothetical protein